ncbi:MAG: gliding motility-associated ABC transporter permease subunit GldF [Bacteroidia bacterium]
MITVLRKEINLFFSSLIAYLVIAVFLIINGIFLWLIPDGNILSSGYATLEQLFTISPWVLMFLVPAITMRMFAEEQKTGTFEILATKPISDTQIVLGKFWAGTILVLLSILPTLVYFYTVYQLANPIGNVDVGGTIGSYIGLLFIGAVYVAIGVFASSLTDNQIVSFILALVICFFFYGVTDWILGLESLRSVQGFISYIGLQSHYNSISRGVVDTRDLVYFIGFIALFIVFTKTRIALRKW